MFPRMVRLPPPWQSWRARLPVAGSPRSGLWLGTAVGLAMLAADAPFQGPAHPPPTVTFQVPPAPFLVINTAWPPATDKPAAENGDPEVTMTVLLLFSEISTPIWVPSAGPLNDDSVVPP